MPIPDTFGKKPKKKKDDPRQPPKNPYKRRVKTVKRKKNHQRSPLKRKKMNPHHLKNPKRSVLTRRKKMKTPSEIFYKHPKYEMYEANEEGHIPVINRN